MTPVVPLSRPVPRAVPPLLGIVAGYLDGVTFLALFGLFVAQVTGSFVIAGAQLLTRDPDVLVKVLAIPAFFCAGMVTTILVEIVHRHGRDALVVALSLEGLLLAGLLVVGLVSPLTSASSGAVQFAILFGLSAMGVQSALVRLLMRGVASTNVMTTNTTLMAIAAGEMARRNDGGRESVCSGERTAARTRPARAWFPARHNRRRSGLCNRGLWLSRFADCGYWQPGAVGCARAGT
jgi:uncharacterized membrane protein YoaK (UPF0700 family)